MSKQLEEAISLLRMVQKNCNCNDRMWSCNICKAIEIVLDNVKSDVEL